jgi:hypothetical protein
MAFYISQILALLVFFFILSSLLTRNKWLRLCLLILGTALAILELSSVVLGNSLIDFKYYAHFNLNVIRQTGGFFLKEAILLAPVPPILILSFWWLGFKFSDSIRSRVFPSLAVLLLTGAFMNMKGGVMANLLEIAQLHFTKKKEFAEALDHLGMSDYVYKSATKAKKGKNIVVIIMESVEESFLQDKLAHLTPNLRRFSREMNYYNMKPAPGSDYTIAAIYTYLTGFPYFFKNHGNEVFGEALELKVNSITHALDVAGYEQEYLLGNPAFAGMGKMMELMGFEVKSEKDFDLKFIPYYWGLHDKDLFDLAKVELKQLIEKKQPYSFFISTISTHPPDGVFDPRMAAVIPEQKSHQELMVAALDRHIGELLEFLEAEGQMEETAIFILPDHLMMGNEARVLNDFPENRELFMITNCDIPYYDTAQSIYQIDVAKMILEGAGVDHNMNFMTEAVEGDKLAFIEKNKQLFIQLNEASLIVEEKEEEEPRPKPSDGLRPKENYLIVESVPGKVEGINPSKIFLGRDSLVAGRGVNLLIHQGAGRYLHEVYDTFDDLAAIDSLLNRVTELIEKGKYFIALVHDSAGMRMHTRKNEFEALGLKIGRIQNRQAYIAISEYGFTSDVIREQPYHIQLPLAPGKAKRSPEEILADADDPDRFIAHAGGAIDGITYTNSIEAMDLAYKKGFRLIELDIIKTRDGHFVGSHDWGFWQKETGYEGEIPPDLETFKQYKFQGKYHLPAMDMINDWFRKHPDAILVTDKVNDPEAFVAGFIDRDRLMMELFSLEAIEVANKAGIRAPILTENLLQYLGGDKVGALQKRHVEHVAVSRRTIEADTALYSKLKQAGIKVYAFHINDDPLYDEPYCARKLMDYCYGLYADNWSFE